MLIIRDRQVKNDTEQRREALREFGNRVNPVDAKLAELEARVAKNRADLDRNNERISARLAELEKRVAGGK